MRHTASKLVTKKVDVSVTCDNCGKQAAMVEGEFISGTAFELPDSWRSFSGGHSDWGNDSVDSYEHFDVCSGSCYLNVLARELANYGWDAKRGTLRIDDFEYGFLRDLLTAAGRVPTPTT